MATGKRDIDNLMKLIKNLGKMKTTMVLVGEKYKQETFKQWNKGKNVGGQSFKGLSLKYKTRKSKKGRKPIPDLESFSTKGHNGGLLRRSLRTRLVSKGVIVGIQTEYAKHVADRNDNVGLWGMTGSFRKKMLKFIFKRLSPV